MAEDKADRFVHAFYEAILLQQREALRSEMEQERAARHAEWREKSRLENIGRIERLGR